MAKFIYPNEGDFRMFIKIIKRGNYSIKKYLPPTSDRWFKIISEEIEYVESTSVYAGALTANEIMARILYKVAKRHDLGDGNKRSAVISVYIFSILNDVLILDAGALKKQAKRIAMTKGRKNEELMKKRVAYSLEGITEKYIPKTRLSDYQK